MASQLAKDIVAAALEEDVLTLQESVDQALTQKAQELVEGRKADFGASMLKDEDVVEEDTEESDPEEEDDFDDQWFEDDDEDLDESVEEDETSELTDDDLLYLAKMSDEELAAVFAESELTEEEQDELLARIDGLQDDEELEDDENFSDAGLDEAGMTARRAINLGKHHADYVRKNYTKATADPKKFDAYSKQIKKNVKAASRGADYAQAGLDSNARVPMKKRTSMISKKIKNLGLNKVKIKKSKRG